MKARRGQLITNYGPGSLFNDINGRTFMISALDLWSINSKDEVKDEERLKLILGVEKLFKPPVETEGYIKSIRFPSWYFCRFCKSMRKYGHEQDPNFGCGSCNHAGKQSKKSVAMVPLRFLVVCENGHASNFPFQEWVHAGKPYNDSHKLELKEMNNMTGLLGLVVRCKTCGASKNMSSALTPGALNNIISGGCKGEMPWRSKEAKSPMEECDKDPIGIQKGASNLYYPVIRSSIFIPDESAKFRAEIKQWVEDNRTLVTSAMTTEGGDVFIKSMLKEIDFYNLLNEDEKKEALEEIKDYSEFTQLGGNNSRSDYDLEDLRREEYFAFLSSYGNHKDFNVFRHEMSEYTKFIQEHFSKITLVESLRDTRAYVGFTRIEPLEMKTPKDTLKKIVKRTYGSLDRVIVDEVRGEGVFFEFSVEKLNKWIEDKNPKRRLEKYPKSILNSLNDLKEGYACPEIFLMIHTFAHMIINEFCLFSGYSTTAIRERLYVNSPGKPDMFGVLIYTAYGDSEGSMGGLVRLGRPGTIEGLIESSLLKANWCSSDPICSQVVPQGPRRKNLAACHNCALLPETSCEHFNSYLDRTLLIKNGIENEDFGFFN